MLLRLFLFTFVGAALVARADGKSRSRRSFHTGSSIKGYFDGSKLQNFQPFGILEIEASSSSATASPTTKRYCEGVLLAARVVLTVRSCFPKGSGEDMYFLYRGDRISISGSDVEKTGNGKYYLIELSKAPTTPPAAYPFLTWFSKSESEDYRYAVRSEFLVQRRLYVSTRFSYLSAGKTSLETAAKTALQNCKVEDKTKLIALYCSDQNVCNGNTVLDGAAFFTFTETGTERVVSIAGLATLRESGAHCKGVSAFKGTPTSSSSPAKPVCASASDGFLCGGRFERRDVESILKAARKIKNGGITLHDNYIPSGTTVGSFNLQGLVKFSRPYAREQEETLRNIIERADILAMQETGTSLTEIASDEAIDFKKYILNYLPGRSVKAQDNFAFVYNSKKFSLSSCRTITKQRIVRCTFENKDTSKQFVIYSVHLTNGAYSTRHTELQDIQTDIAALTEKVIMIVGDFNVGAGNGINAFKDTKEMMNILKNMQFPDPGTTTYRELLYTGEAGEKAAESHYDRFAVSKNVRLVYDYFPQHTDDVGVAVGTILNAPDTEAGSSSATKATRLSTLSSSCPPGRMRFPIFNQNDRILFFNREFLACYPKVRRQYMPTFPEAASKRSDDPVFRNSELSDHLPVAFNHKSTVVVATWNMKRFDPTINSLSTNDKAQFKETKEIVLSEVYRRLFSRFHIVAIQELTPTKKITRFDGPHTNGYMYLKKARLNKNWYWSPTTPELGFAAADEYEARNCEDVSMKAVSTNARPAFRCDFYKKATNTFVIRLFSVHVKNEDSSPDAAKAYIVAAKKSISSSEYSDSYVLGDFNAVLTDVDVPCGMTAYKGYTYTMLDSFKRLDYVWRLSKDKPGVTECRVYNPEILRVSGSMDLLSADFEFSDYVSAKKRKTRMKAFPNWKAVSDHYPVYMKFFVP